MRHGQSATVRTREPHIRASGRANLSKEGTHLLAQPL